jgi:PAS domain S-box-containing protein
MNKFIKSFFLEAGKSTVLVQLRERLLQIMLYGSFVVGTVLFGLALIPVLQKGLYATILIYSFLYLWTILITFGKRLPYRLRAIGWLGIFYVFGNVNLVNSGFNVDSGLFFITFIAMAILLMDLPAGLIALVLGSISISILGFKDVGENLSLPMGLPQSNPLLWIIGGTIFFLMGTLLIYSLSTVVTGLEENLEKTTLLAGELEKTNQSLRMSEARYRALVDTSPNLVVLLDFNATILMVNQFGLALWGYEHLEEVVGKNLLILIAPEDRSRVAEAFKKCLENGGTKDFEFLAIRKDGGTFYGEISSALVADDSGGTQAVIGVGGDVTARKEAEQLLRETKDALAEKVVDATYQLRKASDWLERLMKHGLTVIFSGRLSDGVLTYVSENIAALLGYEAQVFMDDVDFWRSRIHPDDREQEKTQNLLAEEQGKAEYEYRFLKKDGTYCWLHGEITKMQNVDGASVEFVGSLSDITERKNAEEVLKNSEARYRNLYESLMDSIVTVDLDGRILQFNQSYVKMLGYEPEELRNLTYMDLTPEKWHDFEREIVENQLLPNGYSDIYEKEYIRKDGSIFPVELRTFVIRDDTGKPSGMWAIVRDISERKIIEQNLRESEGRYRNLLDNSMQGVIVFQDMRIVYVNEAVTQSLGYTQVELNSLTPAEIIRRVHPDDQRMFQEKLRARLEDEPNPERYSLRIIHKNGGIRWVEARTVLIDYHGMPALMTTAIDVSEIKQAQVEVQESEKTQRSILNASDALVVLADTNGVIITSNEKFIERLGLKADSLSGTVAHEILPEVVTPTRWNYFNQVVSFGEPITFTDSREGIWFENSFYPIKDEFGKVMRVAVYIRDITEQRRVTEALRVSEEQYRKLAEAAHDMIFIINRDDRIEYVNSFGAKFLGKEPGELVGQPRVRFFPSETSEHQEDSIRRVIRTGEAISSESANIFPTRTVWLNTWLVPLKNVEGKITSVLGVSRDITERKKAEEELQQARDLLEERVAERTNELLVSQEKMRFLTAQTIKAQEEERRSISRELHDEAGQALITLKYSLAAIESAFPETYDPFRQRLSDAMRIIDQTNAHIRTLAHSLRPPVLEIGGINLSLQDYCQEQSERTQIPIYYQGVDIPGLSDEIGISLYRFVQEALTNILKHAQATHVKIRLQTRKNEILVSVSDNGRGIEELDRSGGVGLLGIKERLSLLGGRLEIHSKKGQGAKLVACVPWVRLNAR